MKNWFIVFNILVMLCLQLAVNSAGSTKKYNIFESVGKSKARKCYRLVKKVKKPTNNNPIKPPSQELAPPKYEPPKTKPPYGPPEEPKPPSEPPKSDSNPIPKAPVYDNVGFDVQAMLKQVNSERSKIGSPPMRINKLLMDLAQKHSIWMSNNHMDHFGDGGKDQCHRCKDAGYKPESCLENVAEGQQTVDAVMTSWIDSPDHYKSMTRPDYIEVGFGMVNNFWTQLFGQGEEGIKPGVYAICQPIRGTYGESSPGGTQRSPVLQSQPRTYADMKPLNFGNMGNYGPRYSY